jgi:hypothetical protein
MDFYTLLYMILAESPLINQSEFKLLIYIQFYYRVGEFLLKWK